MAQPLLPSGVGKKKAGGGAFGTFRQAVEPLGRADWSGFTFPKVVVLGSESAGKSSLLENLMKCPVFPRNRSQAAALPDNLRELQK